MAEYTDLPIPDDRDSIADSQVEYHQAQIPGWEANAGDPATLLIESTSEQHSETRVLVKDRARVAFADLLDSIYGIPRVTSTQASGDTTWTVPHTDGVTIPAGTLIESNGIAFETTATVTIPGGSSSTTTGEVPILAIEAGSDANGLTGDASLIDTTIDVDTIEIEGETAGGSDGETLEEFLDRGVDTLSIYSAEPITPSNFEVLSRQVEGVERALAIDLLKPGTNERQTITSGGTVTGGTFTLTYSGQTTAAIAYNASAATVQSALEALSNIAPGDVLVTGGPWPGSVITVEFTGTLAETNVAQMTASGASLTGTSPTITIATSVAGVAALTNEPRNVTVAIHDADGEPVPGSIKTQVDDLLQSKREVNFVVNVIDPTYTTFDVTVDVITYPGWDTDAVQTQVEDAIGLFLDPSAWGQPPTGETRMWVNKTKLYATDLIAAIENVDGVDHIDPGTLEFGKTGTTLATSDVTMAGHAPLPRAGTITVTAA